MSSRSAAAPVPTPRAPARSWAPRVHGPRASPRRGGAGRRARRRLRPGRDPLRDPDRQAAVRRRTRDEIRGKAAQGDLADALHRLDASAADPELIAWPATAWPPTGSSGRATPGIVAARITAYLAAVQERLRKAELARVEAQARAEEERKRRRTDRGAGGVGGAHGRRCGRRMVLPGETADGNGLRRSR